MLSACGTTRNNRSFFHIFYNDVFKTNEAVWRFEDKEFKSFKEYLTFFLLTKVCKNKQSKAALNKLDYNSISIEEVKQITHNKDVVNFLTALQQIDFCYFASLQNSLTENNLNYQLSAVFTESFKKHIRQLFDLLKNNRQILLPYIEGGALDKYFPNILDFENPEDLEIMFKTGLEALRDIARMRNYTQRFIWDNIVDGNKIDCFVEMGGVFYEVIGYRDGNQDVVLHPYTDPNKHGADVSSSNHPQFMLSSFLAQDVKEKLYFPDCSNEDFLNKGISRLNSFLVRNIVIIDEASNKETKKINIDDAQLYVSKESLLKLAASQDKKTSLTEDFSQRGKRGAKDKFDEKEKPAWKYLIERIGGKSEDLTFEVGDGVMTKRNAYARHFKKELKSLNNKNEFNQTKIVSMLQTYCYENEVAISRKHQYDHFTTLINKAK